ncbi:hypothetical protein [Xenorhabdus koppenhoeferi]|nr:hypothetical protein [Xenorhabdus sp. Vera]
MSLFAGLPLKVTPQQKEKPMSRLIKELKFFTRQSGAAAIF